MHRARAPLIHWYFYHQECVILPYILPIRKLPKFLKNSELYDNFIPIIGDKIAAILLNQKGK